MNLYFSISVVFCCLVLSILLFSSPLFKFLDLDISEKRNNNIDGVRYYLAALVIFHHLNCSYNYITTGKWWPTSDLMLYFGKYGVAVFFMITAYLFWGMVRDKKEVDWVEIYSKRAFRIMPLAFFCSFVGVFLLLTFTEHNIDMLHNIRNILPWFDGGLWDSKPQITSFQKPWIVMAGVTWTLKWEWIFYFSLPLFFLINKKPLELVILLFAFSLYFLPGITRDATMWAYFFTGMLCRELAEKVRFSKSGANTILVLSVCTIVMVKPALYMPPEKFLLLAAFFGIVSGADLFGLLTLNAVKRLGAISYSLYLTQGLIMFPAFYFIKKHGVIDNSLPLLAFLIAIFLSICIISSLTFHYIESPFINRRRVMLSKVRSVF